MKLDYFAVMAARSEVSPARWRRPFLAWLDGIEKGWAIPALLVAFSGTWLLFFCVAYLGSNLHFDTLETWSIGREFAWGNPKHPPLMGWAAYLWSWVFPLTDWSFQLLAMTNAAVALWAVDLIAKRFVRGDKRALVLLLAMLLPAYQFHAQRFNANTVLLAIWPLATYCFLRAFESRRAGWSAAAGALAAVAMLGKYYSIFLIGSFALAAVLHPQRAVYFRSVSPWLSTLAGLLVLAPHIHWLATTGAMPFGYAMSAHAGIAFWPSTVEALKFLLGVGATLALPAIVWALIAETRLLQLPADFRALDSGLWLLFLICMGTLLLPPIASVAIGTDMPSLWGLQGLFLVAILIVCGARYSIERFHTVNLMVLVFGIALLAVTVAAPVHAAYRNAYRDNNRAFSRLAALELTRRWHEAVGMPMPAISGDDELAFATAFYSPDHPLYRRPFQYQGTWGMPRVTTLQKGWAAMCFADDSTCLRWMDRVAAEAPDPMRSSFIARPRLWGRDGATAEIVMLMVPPVDRPQKPVDRLFEGSSHGEIGASRRAR